ALAHGQKQWLEIAMLIASDAQILLLDEPTAGMSATETSATVELIRQLQQEHGIAALVIEHDMNFVRRLACPVVVMLHGAVLFEISNGGIAYVPQGREIFRDFTVEENLRLGLLRKHGMAARVPDAIYARFPILAERRWQRAETMSGGEQQQLAIARAVVGRPRLLLLDEPSEGIQPSLVESIATTVSAISREDGTSVLLVEQNLDLVLALTTRCLFI